MCSHFFSLKKKYGVLYSLNCDTVFSFVSYLISFCDLADLNMYVSF